MAALKKTLVVVTAGASGVPHGTAPTVRALAYARMHQYVGQAAELHVVSPSEKPGKRVLNTEVRGVASGCPFVYTCGTTIAPRRRPANLLVQARGLACSMARVFDLARGDRLRAVLVYPTVLGVAAPLVAVARACGVPVLLDVCEAPLDPGDAAARLYQRGQLRVLYSLFDGVVAISHRLHAQVRSLSGPRVSVMKMGVLMDAGPFLELPRTSEGPRTIVFAGYLNEPKDGVGSLISAFAGLPPEDADARLVVVGQETEAGDEATFRRQAEDLDVADRVDFTGRLDREELVPAMARATVLALARPASVQAEAGFPTKLSEYLATGNPVVVTSTGEIPRFLRDRRDAYLVPPGDHSPLVAALHEALDPAGSGRDVGARGRAVALRRFDYRANAARFDAFIAMLEDSR